MTKLNYDINVEEIPGIHPFTDKQREEFIRYLHRHEVDMGSYIGLKYEFKHETTTREKVSPKSELPVLCNTPACIAGHAVIFNLLKRKTFVNAVCGVTVDTIDFCEQGEGHMYNEVGSLLLGRSSGERRDLIDLFQRSTMDGDRAIEKLQRIWEDWSSISD